ncbi:MAG: hypothetical protein LC753_18075 [Acidobacteria bacterium]|nr:hypothetical protein [Acidobacteriota bacterium]MCA1652087.1 hypothetical protein [Acidobacteriota bacterium]
MTLGLLLTAADIAVFGGIRLFSGPFGISLTTVWRVVVAGVIVGLVRHLLMPRPSLVRRAMLAAAAAREVARARRFRVVTPVWITFRLGILVVGLFAVAAIGVPRQAEPLRSAGNPLLDLAERWDAGWYVQTAIEGYRWRPEAARSQQNIAFFPGYPVLMHIGGAILGARPRPAPPRHVARPRLWRRTLLGGWLIALGASYFALNALYTWAWNVGGRIAAARSVVLMSAYPFALYSSAAYTESLFVLGALSAFNNLTAGRAGLAAGWGLFVGLIRPNGFLLTLPLAVIAARHGATRPRLWLAAAAPGIGMALFSGYIWWLTGRPLAWAEAHAAWGRTPLTWNAASASFDLLASEGVLTYATTRPFDMLNGVAVMFALSLTPIVWRRLGAPATVFVLVNLVPPLLAGGLMSMGRLTSTLFPLFVALALIVPRRHMILWVGVFALLQGLAAAIFFTWRPLV